MLRLSKYEWGVMSPLPRWVADAPRRERARAVGSLRRVRVNGFSPGQLVKALANRKDSPTCIKSW